MDIQGWVWQSMLPQYVCTESYSDTTVYNKHGNYKTATELNYTSGLVYPNPITRGSTLSLVGFSENVYSLRFCDLQGRKIVEIKKQIDKTGSSYLQIPPNISSGIYLLQISTNNKTITHKISVL